ncbi:MAG: mechanosensitive ion channel family protein [Butyrivibrio sp.]
MILAANIFDSDSFRKVMDVIINWCMSVGKNILIALLVLFVGTKVIKWALRLIEKSLSKSKIEPIVLKFLLSLIKFILYALIIIIIVGILGIPTSSFIAALSAAGLTIGLALQGSLSNFAGGVLILLFKPFSIGDYIREDTHNNEGTVTGIDLFYTKLQTPDNKYIVVPNGTLANSSLTNFTSQKKRRLDLTVGISYSSDIKLAKNTLMDVIKGCELVLKDEDIVIYVDNLAESQITIGTRVWTSTDNYWTAKWELLEKYKEALDAKGIEIPFNQLSVTINDNKPEA